MAVLADGGAADDDDLSRRELGCGGGEGVLRIATSAGASVGPGVAVSVGRTIVKPRTATEITRRTAAESRHSR